MPLFTVEVIHRFDFTGFPAFPTDLLTATAAGVALNELKGTIMAAIDDLSREVAENQDATQSAITLLGNLKTKLDEAIASGDMGQVQALSDTLSNQTDSLAAAVAQNTPADPNA